MNDFSDLENQLRKLRPTPMSEDLAERIGRALAETDIRRASVPDVGLSAILSRWYRRFTRLRFATARRAETPYKNLWRGLGLAAAAVAILVLAQVNLKSNKKDHPVASTVAPQPAVIATTPEFIPADFTRVVYHTSNDGLYFPSGSGQPVRRLQAHARETFEWRNPKTGATLRVSYPSDEVSLVPVSGQ